MRKQSPTFANDKQLWLRWRYVVMLSNSSFIFLFSVKRIPTVKMYVQYATLSADINQPIIEIVSGEQLLEDDASRWSGMARFPRLLRNIHPYIGLN